ncbi:unnamed protein product [Phyllotreta striolata]|uniref:HSF-type DNA-binding domain-containing protein n=1 Tax=Phyllotreta striolata TaxID=444603 RepID=A0A9N9TKB5_PHYSR|nr:unnamed protein product [Phyllotreta striolata]
MQPFGENMSNIPAFLGKLWKMVNDPNTDHLICWSQAGNSFIIQNQAQFWYELLPLYYKHNNMSSFVRQLNMYGFHKISTIENGTMDADKDEIQFFHKYFQKDQPELLRNIKRKVTVAKSESNIQNVLKFDDLSKVFTDVKQLYGRQSNVDSQLSAMKQENAVLWRELAMLRQKHLKQQQIVNKLIQFLVTLVQPSPSSRMGVSVKRRMPLMLHESPMKKPKNKKPNCHDNDNGPTIHELDSEIEIMPDELFNQDIEAEGSVTSPQTSVTSPLTPQADSTKPSTTVSTSKSNPQEGLSTENLFIELDPDDLLMENPAGGNQSTNESDEKVFLNPMGGNTLLSNIANGSYNANVINAKNGKKINNNKLSDSVLNSFLEFKDNKDDLTVATRINNGTLGTNDCSRDDLDTHLEATQSELDQLKDILRSCNGVDANALLGVSIPRLFADETPSFGLPYNPGGDNEKNNPLDTGPNDPMVSGSELATYGTNLIDFNELFDDSLDGQETVPSKDLQTQISNSTINTPMVVKEQPVFPSLGKDM